MIVNCDFCGCDVEKKKSNSDGKNFCDSTCYGNWMSDNRTGEDHPNYSKIEVECEYCGDVFQRKKWRVETHDKQFCDESCNTAWMRNNAPSGEEHHQYDSVEVKCSNCSKKKTVGRDRLKKQDNFYCDVKCQVEHQGRPQRTNEGERVEIKCEQCGVNYKVHPYRKEETKFCSKECVSSWLSENNSGENHCQFEDYEGNYGKDWPKERWEARDYYENQCQVCLKYFDEETEWIPVHHLISVGNFEKKNDAHFQENLVQVCRGCHFKLEYSSLEEQVKKLEDTKYGEKHGEDILFVNEEL